MMANPARAKDSATPPIPWNVVLCGLLVVVTLAAYSRTWQLGFSDFDDPFYVTENPHVKAGLTLSGIAWAFTTTQESNWHPLTWLSLQLDATIAGLNPRVFHTTNLLLHLANTLLLFLILSRMTGFVWRSAFVAALFAIHPLHVESVAWISERKDVLSTLFWLLTLAAYLHYLAHPSIGRYATIVVSLLLGLLAKPMLVSMPIVLLLLDYWPLGRRRVGGSLLVEKAPLFSLAAVASAVTLLVQRPAMKVLEDLTFPERAANALISYALYIGQVLLPVRLSAFYPHRQGTTPLWMPVAGGLFLAGASVGAIALARRRPWLPVGWFWYVITLLPVIGLIQVGHQARADRYTYVPLIGLFVIAAWSGAELIGRIAEPRTRWLVASAGAGAIVVALAAVTWVQVGYWRSGVDLFRHAIEVTHDNAVSHYDLALSLDKLGAEDESVANLREALRISPRYKDAHYDLTHHLMKAQSLEEAAMLCRQQQEWWPTEQRTLVDLGILAVLQGRREEAERYFAEAVRLYPDAAEDARHNLAVIQGEKDEEAVGRVADILRKGGLGKVLESAGRRPPGAPTAPPR